MIATERRPGAYGDRLASVREAAKLLTAAAMTALPQRIDATVTRAITRSVGQRRVARVAQTMQRCLGRPPPGRNWRSLAEEHFLVRAQGYWARARGIHRRGWSAALEVEGLEHLQRALQKGSGAVLWRMDFCASHIPKQALHQLGFPMVHVSRAQHGAPTDDFIGRRIVAPLFRRAEERHLAERIEIGSGGDLTYLRALLERLDRNGVVSIMAEFPGKAGIITSVCGVDMEFAAGAPSLARSSAADLLTMYAYRIAYDRYRVVIEEPIPPIAAGRAAGHEAAVAAFGARLQRAITAHPESWMRWERLP